MKPSLIFGLALGWVLAPVLPVTATAAPFAYVTNQFSNSVSVIDTATNMVTATIPVGREPSGVAITPDGTKAYVTNYQSLSVSVIDIATNTVTKTVPVGERSIGVAVHPDGTKVYVIGQDDGTRETNNVIVIDTVTDTVSDRFPSGGAGPPGDSIFIAVTPDGSTAYVTNRYSQTVSIIKLAMRSVVDLIALEDGAPSSLAITPDGAKVYVGNDRGIRSDEDGPGIVWVIDTNMNTVSQTISTTTPGDAFDLAKRVPGVAITPDGMKAYVTLNSESRAVSIIDTATNTVPDTILVTTQECSNSPFGTPPARGCPRGIAITPDGSKAYVTIGSGTTGGDIAVIDIVTKTWVDTIPVGNGPLAVAITPLPLLRCVGFDPPMDNGAVTVKKNRVLPLKAALVDKNGNPITDVEVSAPPVIQVFFDSGIDPAVDVTDQALSAGQGTDGNEFEFSDGKWRFNLQTKNYTAPGTYTVTMVSGDDFEYTIDPTCIAGFVIK